MDSRLLALGLGALAVMGAPRDVAAGGLAGARQARAATAPRSQPGDGAGGALAGRRSSDGAGGALAGRRSSDGAEGALAGAGRAADARPASLDRAVSAATPRVAALSVGWPTGGRLVGGVELMPGPGLSLVRDPDSRFGLPALVGMLGRAGKRLAARHPGSRIAVGDLSRRQGGDIDGHRSHESGRDVDVGFFLVDGRGKPVPEGRFASIDDQGRATAARDRGLRFDEVRNWSLVQAWLTDPGARVLHVFVAAPLRERLLEEARRRGVSTPLLHRAGLALRQPSRGAPHDDHFHVRIACPRVQRDVCAEEPPRADEPVASRREARPEARWQGPGVRGRVGL